ncbi:MAG: hypothetical protein GX639_09485 [Fibrobacter sp.]|nr:hypothetical protein [Fibrobacter sp.]
MKRLLITLVSSILLLPLSEIKAEKGNKNSEDKISYIITSGENIRVEKNKLVKSILSKKSDFTVTTSEKKQIISGFGGAFNEQGWEALGKLDESERQKVLTAIFSSSEANFSYGRIPIGASDYALERYC